MPRPRLADELLIHTGVALDPAMLRWIDHEAKRTNSSRSSIVRRLMTLGREIYHLPDHTHAEHA